MIARVAALGQRIAFGLALEVRARHVVEQQVVFQVEKLPQPLFQKISSVSLCGKRASNARYSRSSLTFSGGTPNKSGKALWA